MVYFELIFTLGDLLNGFPCSVQVVVLTDNLQPTVLRAANVIIGMLINTMGKYTFVSFQISKQSFCNSMPKLCFCQTKKGYKLVIDATYSVITDIVDAVYHKPK